MEEQITAFIAFSEELERIKSLDIISFKKLYNKKLSAFLLTGTENAKEEVLGMQKSFNDFLIKKPELYNKSQG